MPTVLDQTPPPVRADKSLIGQSLIGMDREDIRARLEAAGIAKAKMRAEQIWRWVYHHGVTEFEAMTNIAKELRAELAKHFTLARPEIVERQISKDGTRKYLIRFAPGVEAESVFIPGVGRAGALCVSSQVGCTLNCTFCHTGTQALVRNLTAAEIVGQVMIVRDDLGEWPSSNEDRALTNIVFMGMGEPLSNYAETVRAVRILTDARAFGLGQRHITISTVGVIRGIDRLAAEGLQVGLAISLHAPNEALRQHLVPTAGPHSVQEIISAAKRYFKATGRRVSFEYALIAGENDSPEVARELVKLLRGTPTHVNLIPVNPTAGGYQRPQRANVVAFERVLLDAGINCTVRVEKGSEISAACGQLRTDERNTIISLDEISSSPVAPRRGHRQAQPSPEPSQSR